MSVLDSKLTPDDLEILIDAMGDWESTGNNDFHVMNFVRNAIMPPDDDPSFEFVKHIKDHFQKREKDIKATRSLRQEKATLLKAKLMLLRRETGIDQLFEEAKTTSVTEPDKQVKEAPATFDEAAKKAALGKAPTQEVREAKNPNKLIDPDRKLSLAERYVKECGLWKLYQTYAKDAGSELSKLEIVEKFLEKSRIWTHYQNFLAGSE